MNSYLFIIIAGAWLTGCAYFQPAHPNLIETQMRLVSGCDMLGVIAETSDADRISGYLARRAMVNQVKARAIQLGATHIAWLHQTETSAAAKAYRCPQPEAIAPEVERDESLEPRDER